MFKLVQMACNIGFDLTALSGFYVFVKALCNLVKKTKSLFIKHAAHENKKRGQTQEKQKGGHGGQRPEV